MVHTVSEWFFAIFPWVHVANEPISLKSRLQKLKPECSVMDAPQKTPRALSPEEEIIQQMAKEYPTLFIT